MLILSVRLYGDDFRGFNHFKAPEIVGAYCNDWNPLGVTVEGFNYNVGFYLSGDNESAPENFWISRKNHAIIEIDSITAVNSVIADAFEGSTSKGHSGNQKIAIEGARRLLSTQIASGGRTGFALYFSSHQELVRVIARLKSAGLDEPTMNLLLQLGEKSRVTENDAAKAWSASWYEIDRLGGIERVTIQGSLEPVKVVSVLHEVVFGAGKINPDLLRRNNFYDPNLSR